MNAGQPTEFKTAGNTVNNTMEHVRSIRVWFPMGILRKAKGNMTEARPSIRFSYCCIWVSKLFRHWKKNKTKRAKKHFFDSVGYKRSINEQIKKIAKKE